MQLDRIRGALNYLVSVAAQHLPEKSKAREDELVRSVLEFGRMKSHLYQTDVTLLDETEIAFRFRESQASITRTFARLEECGFVERTALPQLWKFSLQGSRQFARNPDAVRRTDLEAGVKEDKRAGSASISAEQDPRITGT
jgi:hypothetical protein